MTVCAVSVCEPYVKRERIVVIVAHSLKQRTVFRSVSVVHTPTSPSARFTNSQYPKQTKKAPPPPPPPLNHWNLEYVRVRVCDVCIFFFSIILYTFLHSIRRYVVIFKVCFRYSIEIWDWRDPCAFFLFQLWRTCHAFSNCYTAFFLFSARFHSYNVCYKYYVGNALFVSVIFRLHTFFIHSPAPYPSRYSNFTCWVSSIPHYDLKKATYLFLFYIHD